MDDIRLLAQYAENYPDWTKLEIGDVEPRYLPDLEYAFGETNVFLAT